MKFGLSVLFYLTLLLSAFSQSNIPEKWENINAKGENAFSTGNYDSAHTYFEQGKLLAEKEFGKQHFNYAKALNNLAYLYSNQGQYTRAEPLFVEALKAKGHPDYADYLNNLALLYDHQGKYAKAELLFLETLKLDEKTVGKDHPYYAISLSNLATVYNHQGSYSKAEPLFMEALRIKENAYGKEHKSYAISLNNLALLYEAQGNYSKAEAFYIQTLTVYEKTIGKNHPYYAQSLNNLGRMYDLQEKYSKAKPLYEQALIIREKSLGKDHPDYAQTLINMAGSYVDQKQYAQAEPLYRQAIIINEKVYGSEHPKYSQVLADLARLYYHQSKSSEAEPLYKQALAINEKALGKDHPFIAQNFFSLAVLYYGEKKYEQAESFFVGMAQNQLKQIDSYFSSLSELEKDFFYTTLKGRFEVFNSFAIQRKTPFIIGEMYNNQLTTKALLFNFSNRIRESILQSKDTMTIKLYEEWQNKRDAIAKVYQMSESQRQTEEANILELEKEINDIEKQLSLKSATFSRAVDKKRYTWKDIQKNLKPNEAAIELIRFHKYGIPGLIADSSDFSFPKSLIPGLVDTVYYVALIVTPQSKSPEPVLITNGKDLETRFIKRYKNSIQFHLEDTLSYSQFWKPIAEVLKRNRKTRKIFLSTDGVYNSVNLVTLQNPSTKKYVSDEFDIQLVTNTKDLITRKAEVKKGKATNASLFGYPEYYSEQDTMVIDRKNERSFSVQLETIQRFFEGGRITALPGTKAEVKIVMNLLIVNQVKASEYLDRHATEEEIKALSNPKILHIATHGFFLQDLSTAREQTFAGFDTKKVIQNPLLRSGLLLANAQNTINGYRNRDIEDGILTAYEAMNLNLDETDLVVLSACETGLGEIRNGEGVYGLQRAFQTAGAKSVLMSLWKVDDNATQELMTTFYKNWLKSGDKREAFRKAQETVRKKYPHPYYWGAFVLIGE